MKKIDLLSEMKEFKMDPVLEVKEQIAKISDEEKKALHWAGFGKELITIPAAVTSAKGRVYKVDEIKRMCVKYDLKFLQTKHYQGDVHPLLGANILKYKQDNQRSIYDFRILAPREAFIREVDYDPILFNYLAQDYYEVVDQWGSDLTFKRRLVALWHQFTMYNTVRTYSKDDGATTSMVIIASLIALAVTGLLCGLGWIIPHADWIRPFMHSFPLGLLFIFIGFFPFLEYGDRMENFSLTDKELRNSR